MSLDGSIDVTNQTEIANILLEVQDVQNEFHFVEERMQALVLAPFIVGAVFIFFTFMCWTSVGEMKNKCNALKEKQSQAEVTKFKKKLVKEMVDAYNKHKVAEQIKKQNDEEVDGEKDVKVKVSMIPTKPDNKVSPAPAEPASLRTIDYSALTATPQNQAQNIIYIPPQLPVFNFDIRSEARPITPGDIEDAWRQRHI